jgi:hypothetical protein
MCPLRSSHRSRRTLGPGPRGLRPLEVHRARAPGLQQDRDAGERHRGEGIS